MKQIILGLALVCTACSGGEVRNTLGLNKSAPDEFRVVARPPLSVPQEFYLYPPDEAIARKESSATRKDSKSLLFGGNAQDNSYLEKYQSDAPQDGLADTAVAPVNAGSLPSSAEETLLNRMGALNVDDNIRATLKEEEAQEAASRDELLEKLREPISEKEPVVDPLKERERLSENKKKNKPVTEGDVPTVTEKESILDSLF